MKSKNFNIFYKSNEKKSLAVLGDIHVGHIDSQLKLFEKAIDYIADDVDYWLGIGDYVDAIVAKDKRYDVDSIDKNFNTPQRQIDYLCDVLEEIKDKCIGLLTGNHEETLRLRSHIDLTKILAKHLNTDYLGYNAFIRLQFERKGNRKRKFDIFAIHGSGTAKFDHTKLAKVLKLIEFINADLFLHGHLHTLLTTKKIVLELNNKSKLTEREKNIVLTGGFLKAYNGGINYIEKSHYPPSKLGFPVIYIKPENLDVEVCLNGF